MAFRSATLSVSMPAEVALSKLSTAAKRGRIELCAASDSALDSAQSDVANEAMHSIQNVLRSALLNSSCHLESHTAPSVFLDLPRKVHILIAHHLDLVVRMILITVCRNVRNTLLSCPALWNRVQVYIQSPSMVRKSGPWQPRLERFLRWSGAEPLHLSAQGEIDMNSLGFWDIFEEYKVVNRAATIYLNLYFNSQPSSEGRDDLIAYDRKKGPRAHTNEMWRILSRPAPLLEQLSIHNHDYMETTWLPKDIFSGYAPRLRRLALVNILPQGLDSALSNVTHLNLGGFDSNYKLLASQLRTIILLMPMLGNLALSFTTFTDDEFGNEPLAREGAVSLCVDLTGLGAYLKKIMDKVAGVVTFNIFDHAGIGMEIFTRDICQGHNYEFIFGAECCLIQGKVVCKWTGQSRNCSIYGPPPLPRRAGILNKVIPPVRSDQFISLALHESQWELFNILPPLPRVENLCLVLATCFEYQSDMRHEGTMLFPVTQPGLHLKFPALRRVTFCSGYEYWQSEQQKVCSMVLSFTRPFGTAPPGCMCSKGCVLSLMEITALLRKLLPPGGRLAQLTLQGIYEVLGWDLGKEICQLMEIVDSLEVARDPPRDLIETARYSMNVARSRSGTLSVWRSFEGYTYEPLWAPTSIHY
ncbi:hypothetical protein BKA62DRAFT_687300 [Auriculariales sp. MPI-PUGE-AT-0066]|nr:hypothetical protein BKA62DRAFT_687300 [Auriculariales sp. MPI-PUGE-AT-0066]